MGWVEMPGIPPFEQWVVDIRRSPIAYFPARQWVKLSQDLDLPEDVTIIPFIDWRISNFTNSPIELNPHAIVEPGTEDLWQRVKGKTLQLQGTPRLYHHERQLYRVRVAMWDRDRYCGSIPIPVEWVANKSLEENDRRQGARSEYIG